MSLVFQKILEFCRLYFPGEYVRRFLDWAVRMGVSGYDRETRRRLSICNIAGFLSAFSSVSFALNFMAYDFMHMKWLIAGNLISALITITAPFWHRFNSVLSPVILASTVAVTLFFFVSELGRDSGIQLNYIGSVAIAFAIFGLRYFHLSQLLHWFASAAIFFPISCLKLEGSNISLIQDL